MVTSKRSAALLSALALSAGPAVSAGLEGTELTIDILALFSPGGDPIEAGFTTSAVVGDGVEFPSLAALSAEVPGFNVIDLAVDAGADFLEIDYDDAGTGFFGQAFFNGYRFTFDSEVAATITGATVNEAVTTNGLTDEDLSFEGNELRVNVSGLPFSPDLFGRIDLSVEGGPSSDDGGGQDGGGVMTPAPIPVPAALPLLGAGLALLGLLRRRAATT